MPNLSIPDSNTVALLIYMAENYADVHAIEDLMDLFFNAGPPISPNQVISRRMIRKWIQPEMFSYPQLNPHL